MLFPPDAPSGAGSPSGPDTAGTQPPAGANPPTSAGGPPDTQPLASADDYRAKYEEAQGKLKAWEKYEDPAKVEEVVNWARQRAAEIQAGKLRLVEDQPPPQTAPTITDDLPANWDDLSSREQAQWYRAEAKRTVAAERAALKAELEAPLQQQLKTIGMQQSIYMQADRLQRETGVPFEEAMQEAMRIANADQSTLLRMAFDSKAAPARMEKEIERRVQEQVAKMKQEQENADLALINSHGAPKFATEAPRDPMEMRRQARTTVLRKIREEIRGRAARSA